MGDCECGCVGWMVMNDVIDVGMLFVDFEV